MPADERKTYNVGYPGGSVESSWEIFLMYVGIHRRCVLVTFRQVSAYTKLVWRAGLLNLNRDEERRAEDGSTKNIFSMLTVDHIGQVYF